MIRRPVTRFGLLSGAILATSYIAVWGFVAGVWGRADDCPGTYSCRGSEAAITATGNFASSTHFR